MLTKHTFKAYDHRGKLVLSTWTKAPCSYAVECAAFQTRLDRGELSRVDVFSNDPHEENRTMRGRRAKLTVVTRAEAS
jgi:hypothetical protein